MTFTPVSGASYYVQVTGYDAPYYGAFTLNYPSPGGAVTAASAPPRSAYRRHMHLLTR